MINFIRHSFHQVDQALPAVLFAALLSLQSLLTAGVADGLIFPELVGPDGRPVTLADLCSSAGGAGGNGVGSSHCGGCTLSKGALVPASEAEIAVEFAQHAAKMPYMRRLVASTPERWQYPRRGPPPA